MVHGGIGEPFGSKGMAIISGDLQTNF